MLVIHFACYTQVYMHAELLRQAYNKARASLAREHVEGQVCVTTDMFRSTVSRRRPSSCTISPVCLPWNAATDSDSSLEQQGIIWKGWQNQHTVCRLSPCYSGSFWLCCVFRASKTRRRCQAWREGMHSLIKHLGASVFSVMCHRFKEMTY